MGQHVVDQRACGKSPSQVSSEQRKVGEREVL